jgi:hypothetical protein
VLQNVKFEGDKLTFSRKISFGDNEFTQNFTGTLKDGKITGTLGDDNFQAAITAIRIKPLVAAVGQWDITYKAGDKDATARLIVSQKADGTLTGEWTKDAGQSTVSNVKFENDKLTLTRKAKVDAAEAESTFEGTVKGDELTGTLKSSSGTAQVAGKRFGTALVGTWTFTSNAEMGPRTSALTVAPDLSGIFESFFEIPIKSISLEGDQVSFSAEMPMGDQPSKIEFKGKLAGKTLNGKMNSPMGGENELTGKKVETVPAPAAPVPAAAAPTTPAPVAAPKTN